MKFSSLEVVRSKDTYLFSRNLEDGAARSLGVSNDLKAFVENRIASGMSSPELVSSLQDLNELGTAQEWDWVRMQSAKSVDSAGAKS